jgi:hypothetical protein
MTRYSEPFGPEQSMNNPSTGGSDYPDATARTLSGWLNAACVLVYVYIDANTVGIDDSVRKHL